MGGVRIASLVPSTTEIVAALGLAGSLVARTHECDHPPEVAAVPVVTRDLLPPGLTPAQVDEAVARSVRDAHTIYALDAEALHAARPEVVLTQSTCAVCAVDRESVDAACAMGGARVVSYDPAGLGGILDGIAAIAAALGVPGAGAALVAGLRSRLAAVADASGRGPRPRVAAVEWPDPIYAPGHWIPEMVEAAGGRSVFGAAGGRSERASAADLCASRPDVIVLAVCGYDLAATQALARALAAEPAWTPVRELGVPIVAVDGSARWSRPGPRVVEGVERLAPILDACRSAPGPLVASVEAHPTQGGSTAPT